MRKIYEIAKAELQTLFYSPVAWLIIVIFVFQISLIFSSVLETMVTTTMMGYQNSALTMKIFANPMGNGLLFQVQNYLYLYIPLLTMGLMSREFSSGSIKLLYSSPVTNAQIIFGKYICYPLTLIEDTGLIVRLSGRNAYMPTYLDGYLELQVENLKEDYKVWTTNNVVATNLLSNPELIEVLNSISPNDFLENVFLCINSNGLKIALNFNESVMEVPTEAPINGTPYQEYKAELDKVIQIIDIIEKSNCSNK